MGLERPCPEDNTPMQATGRVFLDPKFGRWYVEYYCPLERQNYVIWGADTQDLVDAAPKSPE